MQSLLLQDEPWSLFLCCRCERLKLNLTFMSASFEALDLRHESKLPSIEFCEGNRLFKRKCVQNSPRPEMKTFY